MRSVKLLTLTALALAGALAAFPAFAQKAVNDGGMPTTQSQPQVPEYNSAGTVVAAPAGNEVLGSDCAARFRSFDPSSGTYLGFDGRRHPCQ